MPANPFHDRAFHAPQNPVCARRRNALTCTNSVYRVCVGTPNDSWSTDE